MGNVRFEQLLETSGLPESDRRNFLTIFSVLPDRRKEEVIDAWNTDVLPRILEIKQTCEADKRRILAESLARLHALTDELLARGRDESAAREADAAQLAAGTQAFDEARAAQDQSARLAKMRALAAAPAADPLAQVAAAAKPSDDPLAALA